MRPPPKQSRALKIAEHGRSVRCCWGCCSDACADATARPADGRARAYSRFLHARGTIPSSAPARLYIRRMAERRRSAPCCWGCGSDACAGRVRTVRERRALPLRRIWSVFAAGDTALFCRGVGFPGRDVPKSIPLFRERSFGRRWQLSD